MPTRPDALESKISIAAQALLTDLRTIHPRLWNLGTTGREAMAQIATPRLGENRVRLAHARDAIKFLAQEGDNQ